MKTRKESQVCDVAYFENKWRQPVKAVTIFVSGKKCVKFSLFSVQPNNRRALA